MSFKSSMVSSIKIYRFMNFWMLDPSTFERNGLKSHTNMVYLSCSEKSSISFCFIYPEALLLVTNKI